MLVALCGQHSNTIQLLLPLYQTRILSGEDDIDKWTDQTTSDAVLENTRIVISTPAVLLDALTHGFVAISRLALCVFDEGINYFILRGADY